MLAKDLIKELQNGDYYDALYEEMEVEDARTEAAGAYWNGERWIWPNEEAEQ